MGDDRASEIHSLRSSAPRGDTIEIRHLGSQTQLSPGEARSLSSITIDLTIRQWPTPWPSPEKDQTQLGGASETCPFKTLNLQWIRGGGRDLRTIPGCPISAEVDHDIA